MINEEKQVCYNMQVYNDFVDFPFAMTNIEDFEFDKLLSHPNPEIRAFNFILITKCTTKGYGGMKKCNIIQSFINYNDNI